MKKFVGIVLILAFALSFMAGAMVTPTQADSLKCEWRCRWTYYYYCCGGPGEEPGCVIVGRCE